MLKIRRLLLLNKRLYKQITYVVLLVLIPIAVFCIKMSTQSKASIMSIGFYMENKNDEGTRAMINEIYCMPEEFEFIEYDSLDEAVSLVENGKLDEVWAFPDNLSAQFKRMAKQHTPKSPITVYLREENVIHLMMKEILESYAFKNYSSDVFYHFAKDKYGEDLTEEELETFLVEVPGNSLFKYSFLDGRDEEEPGYLLSPIRGLLAILLMVTALAASMYYIEDENNGLFIYWSTKVPNLRRLGYYAVIMFNSSVLVFVSFYLAGVGVGFLTEIVNLLLYDFSLILFSIIANEVFRKIKSLGVFLPLMVIISLILSPIFINLKMMIGVQRFIPSYYYLMSTYDSRYTISMITYCFVEIVILEVINGIKKLTK